MAEDAQQEAVPTEGDVDATPAPAPEAEAATANGEGAPQTEAGGSGRSQGAAENGAGQDGVPKKEEDEKKPRKVFELPGQTMDPPDETDPLRKFYTSLLRQRPGSHMANDWCIRRGLLPREQAEEWLRVNRPGALTPKKPRNAAPRKRVKKEDGEDTPKKAFARKGGKKTKEKLFDSSDVEEEKPAPRKRPPAKVKDEDGPAPKRARAKAPPKRRVKMADSDEEIDNDDDDDAEEGAGPSAPAAGSSRSTPKRASRVAPGAYKEEPEEAGEQESD